MGGAHRGRQLGICLFLIFKRDISGELKASGLAGREIRDMLLWWVHPAPLICWSLVGIGLLWFGCHAGKLRHPYCRDDTEASVSLPLRREVRRNQLVRIHTTLLVIGCCLAVVLAFAGFGHELVNVIFYHPARIKFLNEYVTSAGGWGALLLTAAGTIYTLIKASPTGGGERERSEPPTRVSGIIFTVTPTLLIVMLGLLVAWWGHGALAALVLPGGHDIEQVVMRSKPLHYITFLGVLLCFIFIWYEMKFASGPLLPGSSAFRRVGKNKVGPVLLAVAVVLIVLLVGRGMWSICTGSFYGPLLADGDTLIGEWSDSMLRILLIRSHPAPRYMSIVITGITVTLLLVRLGFRRVMPPRPGLASRFVWAWKGPRRSPVGVRHWLPWELVLLAVAQFFIILFAVSIVLVQSPNVIADVGHWLLKDATRNLTAYVLFGIGFSLMYLLVELWLGAGRNTRSLGLLTGVLVVLGVLLSISYVEWDRAREFSEGNQWLLRMHAAFGLVTALLSWTIAIGWTVDPNMLSLHTFYKARLTRAYLGASNPRRHRSQRRIREAVVGDDIPLAELRNCRCGGPYHVINATLNLVGGRDLATAQRSAANFILTQNYCGSLRAGFRPTNGFMGGMMMLGTAVSTSGAAAGPNMGAKTPTAALAMLMTLFNVRLGYWAPTPNQGAWDSTQARLWPFLTLREFLSQTNDLSSFCYLTDGGHFDNTGIYALVERGCRCILLIDCGTDPAPCFADLGDAIRRCRIDFGTEFDLDVGPVTTTGKGADRRAPAHYVAGTFTYSETHYRFIKETRRSMQGAPADAKEQTDSIEERTGYIVVVKPVLTGSETVDIRQYGLENDKFPQQSTSDQWFDEAQFESCRKLGEMSICKLLADGREFGWHSRYSRLGKPDCPVRCNYGDEPQEVIRRLQASHVPDSSEMHALFRTIYEQLRRCDKK